MKLSVVIPAYKAKKTISRVLNEIPDWVAHVIVVDDGCPEGTGKLINTTKVDRRVSVLINQTNQGVGGATVRGINRARQLGCDLIVKMDADCQMDPKYLDDYLKLANEGALYIKGNRLGKFSNYKNMPWVRILGNKGLARITRLGTGLRGLNDPTNGYIALSAQLLD